MQEHSKIVLIPEVGEIKITRRKQCRRLCISVNMQKRVSISIPLRVSFSEGEKFLLEKLPWIKQNIIKIDSITSKNNIQYNENLNLSTRSRKFEILKENRNNFKLLVKPESYAIICPENIDLGLSNNKLIISRIIKKCMRFEASEYLPVRIKELSENIGLNVTSVRINMARTRWGSCSFKNNINLNASLIMLPEELSDYVMLHELAHIKHKNHQQQFWNYLEKICPNAKIKAKKLRNYRLNSIFPNE